MKALRLLKVVSLSSVLMMAMAFSCQDHHVPEPVNNCERVDGTPRAFPCEFEITKLEFLRTNTSQVVKTVLPGSPVVQLPLNGAYHFQYGSQRSYAIVDYRVRIYVKRIADPSFQPVGGYELAFFQLSLPSPPYPAIYNDIIGPSGWGPPPSPAGNPVAFDMPVGETRTVETMFHMIFSFEGSGNQIVGDLFYGIVNNTTARTLIAAPYNYNLLRDAYEARIPFTPSVY